MHARDRHTGTTVGHHRSPSTGWCWALPAEVVSLSNEMSQSPTSRDAAADESTIPIIRSGPGEFTSRSSPEAGGAGHPR